MPNNKNSPKSSPKSSPKAKNQEELAKTKKFEMMFDEAARLDGKDESADKMEGLMRVSTKHNVSFYVRAAAKFLHGHTGVDGVEKKVFQEVLVSGIGNAIPNVCGVASILERLGAARIVKIQTRYTKMERSGDRPHLMIVLARNPKYVMPADGIEINPERKAQMAAKGAGKGAGSRRGSQQSPGSANGAGSRRGSQQSTGSANGSVIGSSGGKGSQGGKGGSGHAVPSGSVSNGAVQGSRGSKGARGSGSRRSH